MGSGKEAVSLSRNCPQPTAAGGQQVLLAANLTKQREAYLQA